VMIGINGYLSVIVEISGFAGLGGYAGIWVGGRIMGVIAHVF